MRSFLTVLGVIIGTGAVIGVGSIIAGLDGAITNLMRSFGPTPSSSPRRPPWANPRARSGAASR
jgi:ABC-type antimicrobial peptide transport system permease subunit